MSIPVDDRYQNRPFIHLYKWLPEKSGVLILNGDSMEVKIHIDKSCTHSSVAANRNPTDEDIKQRYDIHVSKIIVEVIKKDISDDIANFIFDERESPYGTHYGLKPEEKEYASYQEAYTKIGIEIANAALSAFNRIISYARNIKGQYQLIEKKLFINEENLDDFNRGSQAESKIEDGEWFRWCPPGPSIIYGIIDNDETYIREEDWASVSEFVQNKNRPNLVFELLANARYLYDSYHMRSSVIEAVTALEIAVSQFGKKGDMKILSTSICNNRIDIDNIGNQIKHLGFSGSIRYLIPLLINEEILPLVVLSKCYKAIEVRNNIVHQGQRGVSSDLVEEILNGVSECCRVLDAHTKN